MNLLILCISVEQMKQPIGDKDLTNGAAVAEGRSKNREDMPPKQETEASTERRTKNREDRPPQQDTCDNIEAL